MSLSEEEVEEESASTAEMAAVSSDHVIYAPKPTYDQLDQYSGKPKKAEEKHRRTGLPIIHAQMGRRGVGDGGNETSDSEEEAVKKREETFAPSSSSSSSSALLPRLPFSRHPRCHSEPSEKPGTSWDSVFPSLQDSYLRSIGVSVNDPLPHNENLSAQEIENKFKQLSLAFKTDRLTLRQRVEVQHRQRDIAEANFEREMAQLRRYIADLHEECMDMDLVDAITQIRKHIEVLTMSSNSLLSASEVWGAVQQEWRVSRALEVLLLHVENVNRLYENDHQELEEMRKLLTEHQIELPSSSGSASSNQSSTTDSANTSRRIRALSLAGIGKQTTENGNRRISLGPGASKSALNQFLVGRSSRRRASMMPDLRPFHQDLASTIEKSLALKAANNVQEKNEENTHSNKGMMNSSITEEGSESGDEGTENGGQDSKNHSPTVTSLRKYNNFPLYGQPLQDNGQMFYDDSSPTPTRSPDTDPLLATNAVVNFVPHSSSWLMQNLEEIYNRFRDGDLPYTNQQVLRGVFTSFLLLVAVFYLVLATSSANDELPEPCLPDWTFKAFRIKFNSHQPF